MTDNMVNSIVKQEEISPHTSLVEIEILPDLSVVKQEIPTFEDEAATAITDAIVKEKHDVIDNAAPKTIFPDTPGVEQEFIKLEPELTTNHGKEKQIPQNEKSSSRSDIRKDTEEVLISPKREVLDTIDQADIDVSVLHEEVDLGASAIDDEVDYKPPGLAVSIRIENTIETDLTHSTASPHEKTLQLSKEKKNIGKKFYENKPDTDQVTRGVTESAPATSKPTQTHLLTIRSNKTTKRKEFVCHKCNSKFSSQHSLKRHLKKKDKLYACHECEYKTNQKGNLKTHLRTHTGEKPFVCDFCDFKCSRKGTLDAHLTIHTREKSYECNICNYKSSRKGNLHTHLKIHTGEKVYACDLCNYQCIFKSNLKRHLRTHSGEKPFACSACDHKYSDKASLQSHLRAHTGHKPYACDMCSCKFTHESNLRRHQKIHTGEKPYVCNVCEYRSVDKSNFQRHLRIHIEELPKALEKLPRKGMPIEVKRGRPKSSELSRSEQRKVADARYYQKKKQLSALAGTMATMEVTDKDTASESNKPVVEGDTKSSAKISDDEIIARRRRQNAERVRAYRERKKVLGLQSSSRDELHSGPPEKDNRLITDTTLSTSMDPALSLEHNTSIQIGENATEQNLHKNRLNAERCRRYRQKCKWLKSGANSIQGNDTVRTDAIPNTSSDPALIPEYNTFIFQSGEPVPENVVAEKNLHQKRLNAERCRRYRQKCKRLKSGGKSYQSKSDSDTSTSREGNTSRGLVVDAEESRNS